MRRPATELLICRDAVCQCTFVDIGKVGLLSLRDLGGRCFIQITSRLFICPDEGLGHVGFKPLSRSCKAGKSTPPDLRPDLSHDMAGAIIFELLGERTLLLNIFSVPTGSQEINCGLSIFECLHKIATRMNCRFRPIPAIAAYLIQPTTPYYQWWLISGGGLIIRPPQIMICTFR